MRRVSCWFTLCALVAVASLALSGCGSGVRAGKRTSPTGGVALRMLITDGQMSHALYVVEPDGTIGFGDGWAALDDRTTWTGAMTEQELQSLAELLRRHGWFDGKPAADDPTDAGRHKVRFAFPDGGWRLDAPYGGRNITPIRQFLQSVSMRRNQSVFDQLPEPGERR